MILHWKHGLKAREREREAEHTEWWNLPASLAFDCKKPVGLVMTCVIPPTRPATVKRGALKPELVRLTDADLPDLGLFAFGDFDRGDLEPRSSDCGEVERGEVARGEVECGEVARAEVECGELEP